MIYARLAGLDLPIRSPITWTLAYGTVPRTTSIEIHQDDVPRVLDRARVQFATALRTRQRTGFADTGPVVLEMRDTDDPANDVVVSGLYILSVGPADRLNTRLVVLADRRWLAPRTLVRRSYNVRKDSGDRRLVGDFALAPEQLGQVVTDYAYRAATLRGEGRPWTAEEVLADVLEEVFGAGGWRIEELPAASDSVESMELLDRGDEALARMSSLFPGLQFYADYSGKVVATSLYSERDRKLVESLTEVAGGDLVLAKREPIVPQGFRVYFLTRTELRFDFVETSASTQSIRLREELTLENVIVSPLLSLTLRSGKVANMGEAIPVQDFLDAVNDILPTDGIVRPPITIARIRSAWLAGWPGYSISYIQSAGGSTQQKWTAIFAAIRSHWRRTFRIRPEWADKLYGLRPQRVAITDSENGSRAKATVHAQYLTRISQLAFSPQFAGKTNLVVDDYAADLQGARTSPFEVVVLNPDIGLIQLSPRTDEDGLAQGYVLGTVDAGEFPSADIRDAAVIWGKGIGLSASFSVAVVVSAQRGVPANETSMHVEEVTLAAAAAKLGIPVPDASGPDYELRAFEDEARFAWLDTHSEQIAEAYYTGAPLPPELQVNGEWTRQIALAHAARKLAETLPRYVGTLRVPMQPIVPTGSVGVVTHTISAFPGVTATTTLAGVGTVNGPSVWSQLPDGIRRVLRGDVDRGGS